MSSNVNVAAPGLYDVLERIAEALEHSGPDHVVDKLSLIAERMEMLVVGLEKLERAAIEVATKGIITYRGDI